ncbi:MAG: transporter, partial [Clostridia bacterium]|nr:transporter [Clostridia bacterium]
MHEALKGVFLLVKIVDFLLKNKIKVIIFYAVALIISFLLMPLVKVNYDLAEYLPPQSNTRKAIGILEDEFSYPGNADLMVENVTINRGKQIKELIKTIDGVKNVIWLDDMTDITQPEEYINSKIKDKWYKNGNALYMVEFNDGNYGKRTSAAINSIRSSIPETIAMRGAAVDSSHMQNVLNGEILGISVIIVPLSVLILMFASQSWIEPLLYLAVMGISVLINMGTNAFFNDVSFITQGMASVLQLAMSMDYCLFLVHRYNEERDKGKDVKSAVINATVKSITSISASSLTTIAGFLALTIMQYGIGADIGLVLAKGIIISYVCVITLMPVILLFVHKLLEKTKHKSFLPSFKKLGRFTVKLRFIIIPIIIILTIPCFFAQSKINFLYGDASASSGEGQIAIERQNIADNFGVYNPVVLLVKAGDIPAENALTLELEGLASVRSVQSLGRIADKTIPRDFLPEAVLSSFASENYSRLIINLNIEGESDLVFNAVNDIKEIADSYYPNEWYTAGTPTSVSDIKSTVSRDNLMVNLFSIISVGIIILFSFKSISLPIILVMVIQASIWINMSIPYFTGFKIAFIGYLIVSALQLGATIDYAILLTSRYLDFRKTKKPKTAVILATKASGASVVISALILTVAGFTEGIMSQISSISEIGFLIGRGALLSGLMVLILLPPLLVLLDPVIRLSTLGMKKNIKLSNKNDETEQDTSTDIDIDIVIDTAADADKNSNEDPENNSETKREHEEEEKEEEEEEEKSDDSNYR